MTSPTRSAWRTENWMRVGGEVFMVQQRVRLYKERDKTGSYEGGISVTLEEFPTDEWRLMSLQEVLPQEDLNKLMEAKMRESNE